MINDRKFIFKFTKSKCITVIELIVNYQYLNPFYFLISRIYSYVRTQLNSFFPKSPDNCLNLALKLILSHSRKIQTGFLIVIYINLNFGSYCSSFSKQISDVSSSGHSWWDVCHLVGSRGGYSEFFVHDQAICECQSFTNFANCSLHVEGFAGEGGVGVVL